MGSSKQFVMCIPFPHEEIKFLFFNYGLDAIANRRGNFNKISRQGNCWILLRINFHTHFPMPWHQQQQMMIRCSFTSGMICIANVAELLSHSCSHTPAKWPLFRLETGVCPFPQWQEPQPECLTHTTCTHMHEYKHTRQLPGYGVTPTCTGQAVMSGFIKRPGVRDI